MGKFIIVAILGLGMMSCKGQKSNTSSLSTEKTSVSAGTVNDITSKIDIDIAEAKKLMDTNKDIVLIDVRTPGEIAPGKISNALEIDISSPTFKDQISNLDKNKEYIVYCAVGGRSATAVSAMQQMGFTKIHNLTPGYSGWSRQ